MANFEVFHYTISSSINLLFLKSVPIHFFDKYSVVELLCELKKEIIDNIFQVASSDYLVLILFWKFSSWNFFKEIFRNQMITMFFVFHLIWRFKQLTHKCCISKFGIIFAWKIRKCLFFLDRFFFFYKFT